MTCLALSTKKKENEIMEGKERNEEEEEEVEEEEELKEYGSKLGGEPFLVADMRLYTLLCWSVRQSVGPSHC